MYIDDDDTTHTTILLMQLEFPIIFVIQIIVIFVMIIDLYKKCKINYDGCIVSVRSNFNSI